MGPETPRVYGGQVLAQSAIAASRTVAEDRPIHSLHGYFLRPGDVTQPITFGVERMRDGRSFSARRIHAYQEGRVILSCLASFQVPQPGLEHQERMPEGVPAPEQLPSPRQLLADVDDPRAGASPSGVPSTCATSPSRSSWPPPGPGRPPPRCGSGPSGGCRMIR
ncbi:Acyl-CoA thioesterase 2 [Rothia kristinae]|nr:Acyl-CoA thioesterase 2 [Rothia kristinae]